MKTRVVLSTLVFLLLAVVVQLIYPRDVTVPFAKINGANYGLSTTVQIEKILHQRLMEATLDLSMRGQVKEYSVAEMGGDLDFEATAGLLIDYPLKLRLIPFSVLFHAPDVKVLEVEFDDSRLDRFISDYSKASNTESVDASVGIEDGEIVVNPAAEGHVVNGDALKGKVRKQDFRLDERSTMSVPVSALSPEVSNADVNVVYDQLEAALDKQIIITHDDTGERFVPTREDVAGWLAVERQEGGLGVSVREELLGKYIDEINQVVGVGPDPVVVKYQDGREVERSGGASGVGVDAPRLVDDVRRVIFSPVMYSNISLAMTAIDAPEQSVFNYTNSEAGLRAKVAELTSRYNAKITLEQIDGAGWTASSRGGESWPSASTYKLYVAAALFDRVDAGEIKWSDGILGRSTEACFESMIVVSTNECAEEWLRKFGRGNVNNFLYGHGISRETTFTANGATRTTTDDLVRILKKYHGGSIVSQSSRDRLFDAMARQIWRKGIPNGSSGQVRDKVGFLWDYTHDAGIVSHPRGTYILAVMTKGHNYGTISQITKEIEEVMYP